mmetsp:Transcript_136668/g.437213  ORF Transcript_136668/g.437213 Transcript_136668/m.437213 type:complete len:261 (+) Transcript_136668:536-1318(+)
MVIRRRLLLGRLAQDLHDVAVQRALSVVQCLLAVLVRAVDVGTRLDECGDATELLLHGCPHERRFATLGVGLQRALLLDQQGHEHLVASLHCAEEGCLPISILVIHLRAIAEQEVAHCIAAELGREEEGCLAQLGDQVDLGILGHKAPHGGEVALCRCPHECGLVLVVHSVGLGTLVDQVLADLPMAVRGGFHEGVLALLRGEVDLQVVLRHEHLADVRVSRERCPHQNIPALVVLEVHGATLREEKSDDIALALLCGLH